MVSNDVAALSLDKSLNAFEDVLQTARALYRKSRANQKKNHDQKCEHQNFHGDKVRNRRLRKLWLNVQRAQHSRDRPRESVVQKFSE